MGTTKELVQFIADTQYKDLPPETIELSKVFFLDWLGVTLAGSKQPLADVLEKVVTQMGGNPQASIIGRGTKTSAVNSAMVNGTMAHALDFDDFHMPGTLHPSAPLFPVLTALSEWRGYNGKESLTAFVLGFEVFCRIGTVLGGSLIDRGYHPTATIGHLATATTAGKLLGLSADALACTLGIAGTQAGGLLQSFGTMCKPFHSGKAAMNGLLAALLAGEGFTGTETVLEGKNSFSQAFTGGDVEAITDGLGEHYELANNSLKPYAACGATHAAIDAVLAIKDQNGLQADEVENIHLILPSLTPKVAANPGPRTGLQGKFSVQYCVALALTEGKLGEDKFVDKLVQSEPIQQLIKKVDYSVNTSFDKIQAAAIIKTRDGREYQTEIPYSKGTPLNPMSPAEIEDKFLTLASLVIPEGQARRIIELTNRMEELDNLNSLIALTY